MSILSILGHLICPCTIFTLHFDSLLFPVPNLRVRVNTAPWTISTHLDPQSDDTVPTGYAAKVRLSYGIGLDVNYRVRCDGCRVPKLSMF